MKRREFMTLLGGLAAWPCAALAQPRERMRRIAVLRTGVADDRFVQAQLAAFRDGLRKLGWIEGRNVNIDIRFSPNLDHDRRRALAAELVALAPDVIFAIPHASVEAMYEQTRTIPIVATGGGDLIAAGFAQSHARPGGNVTGFMTFEASINTKYLQLLKDMVPNLTRVTVMQTEGSNWRGDFATIAPAARSIGIEPSAILFRDGADIERTIVGVAREPNGGMILPPDNGTNSYRRLIVSLAAKHRLPVVYSSRSFVAEGGLMSYSSDPTDIYRQAAGYVDRILRGAKPADLPVQSPVKFELVINTKAAAALGIEVPLPLLIRADELIE
jgi:putative ABC transport system substrate-binding protein